MPKKKLVSDIISVDMAVVGELVEDGVNIVATPAAEDALLELLRLQSMINTAVFRANHVIEERGLELNPNFSSVQSDKVKIGYRYYGTQYGIDPANLDKLPKDLYKQETKYSLLTKELKAYLKKNNILPLGVYEKQRTKTLTMKPLAEFEEAE